MKYFAIAMLFAASTEAKRLNAQPITADSGLYDSVSSGWSGKQLPGRAFERPDTGLDDDTVLRNKAGKVSTIHIFLSLKLNQSMVIQDFMTLFPPDGLDNNSQEEPSKDQIPVLMMIPSLERELNKKLLLWLSKESSTEKRETECDIKKHPIRLF